MKHCIIGIASGKRNLYGTLGLSIFTLIYLSLACLYFTRQRYPPNQMYSPEESLDHKVSLKENPTTRKARGITSRRTRQRWSLLDINATSSLPPPRVGNYKCRDQICSEFLSAKDKKAMHSCTSNDSHKISSIVPKCHFMNGTHRSPVALVSFAGSGNTWVRGLLEKATGVCTGSEYCDNIIRNSGAIGERISSGSVLVVKTHRPHLYFGKNAEVLEYAAAILLLRNPLHAMVSEWNRKLSAAAKLVVPSSKNTHVAILPQKYFGKYPKWQAFVAKALVLWKKHITNVLLNNGGYPVLVVCYEDVLRSTVDEVKRMLDFLKVPYSDSGLKKRLTEDYDTFHRNHTSTFEHFTENQKQLVRAGVNDVLHQLKQRKKTIPGLKKYLASTALAIT